MKAPDPSMKRRHRRGSVAIQVGLVMVVVLGMIALGTEATFLFFKQRQMQAAADAAAYGAATAVATGHPSNFRLEAYGTAANAGFENGVRGTTVTINVPPLSGNYAGNSSALEVLISQPQTLSLASLFHSPTFTVAARAVAILGGTGTSCVLQLNSGNITGFSISNGATVNLVDCGLGGNSTSSAALSATGGAILNTLFVSVSGGTSIRNGAIVNATNGIKVNQPPIADPYASVAYPSYSGCNFTNKSYGHNNAGRQYISPGVYCNGLAFTNDAIITMNPGVYVVDRGTFDVGGAVQLDGTGVTIFLTSSTGSNWAKVNIGNGARVTLSAPNSGALSGLTFFGDRRAPSSVTSNFNGGANLNLTGSIYLPTQTVIFANGISNPSGCTQLIGGILQFTGGAQFKKDCGGTGVIPVGGAETALVE